MKKIHVLVRQYLKLGGRFVGFNVAPDFSDVIDGLFLVDLRIIDRQVRNKYMGADNAGLFLEHPAATESIQATRKTG